MSKRFIGGALGAVLLAGSAFASEGPMPVGVPPLNHVFVIMMENHGYGQILTNPNAPFTNQWANEANLATNYFGVGHPSLTNYLEVVGGSNFGVRSDNAPDFHDATCQPNLVTGVPNTDNPASPSVCPIALAGVDAATPAVDCTNEYTSPNCGNDIDGVKSYPAAPATVGKTIADQLVAVGKSWKAYEENLPLVGADNVVYSDGVYTNLTDFTKITPTLNPPLTSSAIVQLYAAKHNPFVYFQSVQQGHTAGLGFAQMSAFDGVGGLWENLASGQVPTYSYIVPNQCDDQHGRGNSTPFCGYDPNDNGSQAGLNPALIFQGDLALRKIVGAIKHSPAWKTGYNAIVAVWDENDYSNQPNINQVVTIVDTNTGVHGVKSNVFYTHFSLLKSIESGLSLQCLNHACDANTAVMTDMFAP